MKLTASVRTKEQLQRVLESPVSRIYIDADLSEASEWPELSKRIREASKEAWFLFPQIVRDRALRYFEKNLSYMKAAAFDGFLIPSLEALYFLQKHEIEGERLSDAGLYVFNSEARETMLSLSFSHVTAPFELNSHEISDVGFSDDEIICFGRIPMMVSANCLKKTAGKCDGKPSVSVMKDRRGAEMPVLHDCRFCMNTILNSVPLDLSTEAGMFSKLGFSAARLSFTVEKAQEVSAVLSIFEQAVLRNEKPEKKLDSFTRGHYKRGVE